MVAKLSQVSVVRTLNAAVQAAKAQGKLAGRSLQMSHCLNSQVGKVMLVAGALVAAGVAAHATVGYGQNLPAIEQDPTINCACGYVDVNNMCAKEIVNASRIRGNLSELSAKTPAGVLAPAFEAKDYTKILTDVQQSITAVQQSITPKTEKEATLCAIIVIGAFALISSMCAFR